VLYQYCVSSNRLAMDFPTPSWVSLSQYAPGSVYIPHGHPKADFSSSLPFADDTAPSEAIDSSEKKSNTFGKAPAVEIAQSSFAHSKYRGLKRSHHKIRMKKLYIDQNKSLDLIEMKRFAMSSHTSDYRCRKPQTHIYHGSNWQ
jgi:hypothetical protein